MPQPIPIVSSCLLLLAAINSLSTSAMVKGVGKGHKAHGVAMLRKAQKIRKANELVESREQARRAEQQAYDAKVHYKTKSDQLAREHKRNAVHFHEQLTGAFEKKMQKLKLKHTQDLFTLKKTGGSRQ